MAAVLPDTDLRRTARANVAPAWILALFVSAIACIAIRDALAWYGRPLPGVLVDHSGTVSSVGLPDWEGKRLGLKFPDRLEPATGPRLSGGGRARAAAWDSAVLEAQSRG